VNFAEQPPSKQWAPLKYQGQTLAEVWFKPEGEPWGVRFRIPRASFDAGGLAGRLTTETLLKTVAIAPEEVGSWRHGEVWHAGGDDAGAELREPLPLPPEDVPHLDLLVRLKVPESAVIPEVGAPAGAPAFDEADRPAAVQQILEARWRAILGLEGTIDGLRLSMENIRNEMETSLKKTLMTEEKVNALNADIDRWNKAKSRAHYALPKAREFIHRATWIMGRPERKQVGEYFKEDAEAEIPADAIGQLADELELLLKERQVLSGIGQNVHLECKGISAEIESALSLLKSNAARNKDRKKRQAGPKGKFFKDIRRWSGVD
jgi:hypothetical protein